MKIIFKHYIQDYFKVYLYIFIIGLIIRGINSIFYKVELVGLLNAIWILISATLLIILSSYYLYEFLYTRKHYFYYTTMYSPTTLLISLAITFSVFNLAYYITYANLNFWDFFQKSISIISYFLLISSLLYSYRSINSKKIGFNLFLLSTTTILAAYAISFYQLFSDKIGENVMIGVSSLDGARNIYNNILPITIFVNKNLYHQLSITTVSINFFIIVFFSLSFFILKKIKINW